jgi:hypothetical protein
LLEQVLIVLIDTGIRTIEKRVIKKMKDYLTKKCARSGILKNFISDPES